MEEERANPRKKFKFLEDQISSPTMEAIKGMGFKTMTDIQAEVLPAALDGVDIVATAKTGSGKTLAFLIPAVETVIKCNEKQLRGMEYSSNYRCTKYMKNKKLLTYS